MMSTFLGDETFVKGLKVGHNDIIFLINKYKCVERMIDFAGSVQILCPLVMDTSAALNITDKNSVKRVFCLRHFNYKRPERGTISRIFTSQNRNE